MPVCLCACGRAGVCALHVPVSARVSLRVCAGVYNVCVFLSESARACCAHICVCLGACVRVRARTCMCLRECLCVRVGGHGCVRACVRSCVTLDLKHNIKAGRYGSEPYY